MVLARFKFPKRKNDWLLGRWTAKIALSCFLPAEDRTLTDWQIVADNDGAPLILENGIRADIPISLSHSGSRALCVLAQETMKIGCDLETIEKSSRSFEETFFTEDELALLEAHSGSDRARLATLIWSAKESALKAMRVGLRMDTRKVEIELPARHVVEGWSPIRVHHRESGREYAGWWRRVLNCVLTILASPPARVPVELSC